MQDIVKQKINEFSLGELIGLPKNHMLSSEIQNHILEIIGENIKTFIAKIESSEDLNQDEIIQIFERLLLLAEYFSEQDKRIFLEAYCSNNSMRKHPVSDDLVRRILRSDLDKSEYLADYWIVFRDKVRLLSDERSQSLFEIVDEKTNNEF